MARTDWRSWGIVLSLALLMAAFIAYVLAPASILPPFTAAFGIDNAAASIAISAIFLTWAVLQIPGGYLMDRYDNRRLVLAGGAGFQVVALVGLATSAYPLFLLTRLLSGAAVVFIFIGSVNVLNRVLPAERLALGIGVFIASPPLGIAGAHVTAPRIAAVYGWRGPFLAYIGAAAVGWLVFAAILRRPITPSHAATLSQFLAALRNPSVLLVSLACCCTYAIWTFLTTWMPAYGTDVLGIELAAAGAAAALVPLAGIVARPGGGWLSDRLGGRIRVVIAASFVGSLLCLLLLSNAGSPRSFAVLLALSGAAVNLGVGLYLVYVTVLADVATQATSLSVLATFAQVGNLTAPVVGGWLIEQFSWTVGFQFGVGLAVLGLLTIVVVPQAA